MSKYAADQYTCNGENPNLCQQITDEAFCNTYGSLSDGDCYWSSDNNQCIGNTSCEMYFEIFQACAPPCEFESSISNQLGGRLRFRIFRDLPSTNAYGQYFHTNDYDMFVTDTGIITPNILDDLYTTMDWSITPFSNENMKSLLDWNDDENQILMELNSLYWDATSNDFATGYFRSLVYGYNKKMWVTVADMDIWDSITDYNSANNYLGPKSVYAERGPWEGNEQAYQAWSMCQTSGFAPYGSFPNTAGPTGWIETVGNSEDYDWAHWNHQQWFSEFAESNIAAINSENINNLFNPISNWVSFLQNPNAILIIGQHTWIAGCGNINASNCFDMYNYGLSKLHASDIKNAVINGTDPVIDIVMEKRFSDLGTHGQVVGACIQDPSQNCCEINGVSTYQPVTSDDGIPFNPFSMEGTWFLTDRSTAFTKIKLETSDVSDQDFESYNYSFFYNMGGKKLADLQSDEFWVDGDESFGGYHIKFPNEWLTYQDGLLNHLANKQMYPDNMYTDWRPIPHVFIGDTEYPESGIYTQKYYDFIEPERVLASAPNIVNLNMYIAEDNNLNVIDYVSYYDKVLENYKEEDLVRTRTTTESSDRNTDISDSYGYLVNRINEPNEEDSNPSTRSEAACCTGAGSCYWTCLGGSLLSFSCECAQGASSCNPPAGSCYSDGQCSCNCTADCGDDGSSDPVVGCMDNSADNFDPFATLPCDNCCIYMGDVDINELLEDYFEIELLGTTPDCTVPYACTTNTDITFRFKVYSDASDFYEEVYYEYSNFLQDWPSLNPLTWNLKLDIGNIGGADDIYFESDGGVYTNELTLEDGETYEVTIQPGGNSQYPDHYADFMYFGSDNLFYNHYSGNPGGINWADVGDFSMFYPRIVVSNSFSNPESWALKPEHEDTMTLSVDEYFAIARLDNDINWVIYGTGCMDPFATNYNPYAYPDDGSCVYTNVGCTDPDAINYDPNASVDNGSCVYYGDYGFDDNPLEKSLMSTETYDFVNAQEAYVQGYIQKVKMFVVNWNFNAFEDDDFIDLIFPSDQSTVELERMINDTYKVVDVFDVYDNGKINFLSHQYNEPGIKVIKAIVLSTMTNINGDEMPITIKALTIKINLTLDSVYVEEFAETGGPDFKFLPFSDMTPVISGLSKESDYIQSLEKILDGDQFTEEDQLDKVNLEKAFEHKEIGEYLGTTSIAQVRFFKDGSFDLPKLLGIEEYYTNYVNIKNDNDYYSYKDYWYWDGSISKYPEETSVGSIFIDDAIHPPNIKRDCQMELNMGQSDGRVVVDTSGNGNKGILFGDYKLSKPNKEIPIRRETEMKLPKIIDDDEKAL